MMMLWGIQPVTASSTPDEIRTFIYDTATVAGVDADTATRIANCESGYDPLIKGDHGKSYGLWQIYLPAHPEITKEQALDPTWSTMWAMTQMQGGKYSLWSCYRML